MIKIFNEDNQKTIVRLENGSIDAVISSPPYNTNSVYYTKANGAYDEYEDDKPDAEYRDWIVALFNSLEAKLKKNGVVVWNCSYGNKGCDLMLQYLSDITLKTNFSCYDIYTWIKPMAIPNAVSPNRTTRISEFVFIFGRKSESQTYFMNKRQTSTRDTGQKCFESVNNVIYAKNNDGVCPLNHSAFSTEFAQHLLSLYCPKGGLVYDPFMGTGTTACAARNLGIDCVGSELSSAQCEYAKKRIDDMFNSVEIVR